MIFYRIIEYKQLKIITMKITTEKEIPESLGVITEKKLTIEEIKVLQEKAGLTEIQSLILTGDAWRWEGSYGRAAMANLELGACFLPDVRKRGAYGNLISSRNDLKEGTTGTLGNSQRFWAEYEF